MKRRFCLLVTLTFICSLSVNAQATASPTPVVQQVGNVKLYYFGADNLTVVILNPVLLSGRNLNKLELDASATFDGKTPTVEPRSVGIGFRSISKKVWFEVNQELILMLDGERLPLGAMKRVRKACAKTPPSGYGCSQWDEKLDINISYQLFSRIIKAREVSGEVGGRKFLLKDSDLEMLREFDKRIVPQGGRNSDPTPPSNSFNRSAG